MRQPNGIDHLSSKGKPRMRIIHIFDAISEDTLMSLTCHTRGTDIISIPNGMQDDLSCGAARMPCCARRNRLRSYLYCIDTVAHCTNPPNPGCCVIRPCGCSRSKDNYIFLHCIDTAEHFSNPTNTGFDAIDDLDPCGYLK